MRRALTRADVPSAGPFSARTYLIAFAAGVIGVGSVLGAAGASPVSTVVGGAVVGGYAALILSLAGVRGIFVWLAVAVGTTAAALSQGWHPALDVFLAIASGNLVGSVVDEVLCRVIVLSRDRIGLQLMRSAVIALPEQHRGRYIEEWRSELYDARADGEPWYQQAAFCLRVLFVSVPALILTLRGNGEHVVD